MGTGSVKVDEHALTMRLQHGQAVRFSTGDTAENRHLPHVGDAHSRLPEHDQAGDPFEVIPSIAAPAAGIAPRRVQEQTLAFVVAEGVDAQTRQVGDGAYSEPTWRDESPDSWELYRRHAFIFLPEAHSRSRRGRIRFGGRDDEKTTREAARVYGRGARRDRRDSSSSGSTSVSMGSPGTPNIMTTNSVTVSDKLLAS